MKRKHIESIFIILLMVASAYLTIGAMDLVQNLPLTIYHFGPDGR